MQTIFCSMLLASEIKAQRSIRDIYLTIAFEDSSIEEVFQEIESKTQFLFTYNQSIKKSKEKYNVSFRNKSLDEVLQYFSNNSDLNFKRVNNQISVKKATLIHAPEIIEEIINQVKITGTVTGAEDGEPLPGVSILIKGTSVGTTTDIDGNYTIQATEGATLQYSYIGYVTQEVQLGSQSVLNVALEADLAQLEEVVVIGYGTREKKDLTGAVGSMGSKDIEKSNSMTPELAMQGRMAGVLVTTPSGNPQDRPDIQIRGIGTFNNREPLYVIDGVPVWEFGSGFEGQGDEGARARDLRGPVNILTLINPSDIESISVLKDASAAAIYGVRAANGVILITTKKGREGSAKIDFNYKTGIKNIPKTYDLLGVPEYTALYQEAYRNNPNLLSTMPAVFNPSDTLTRGLYDAYLGDKPSIDWQDPMLNKNAALRDYSVKIYGGTENVDYYIGGGYSYQEGPLINNFMERYSFSTNVNAKAGKHFEAGTTLKISYLESKNQSPDLSNAVGAPAWQPIRAEDDYYAGNIPDGVNAYGYATSIDTTISPNPNHPNFGGEGQLDKTPIYNQDVTLKYGPETEGNVFAMSDSRLRDDKFEYLRGIGSVYAAVKFLDGFKLKGSYSVDWYYQKRNQWISIDRDWYRITSSNFWDAGDRSGTTKGSYGERHSRNFNLLGEITLNYNKFFGNHNIDVVLSFMDQRYGMDVAAVGSDQIIIDNPDRRFVPEQTAYANGGSTIFSNGALQGYMGRASYNYNSKYYLDVTVRRDGSYKFAPDYRWGTFPSVAAAWRITSEEFMSQASFLNDLKMRAGWGQLGNQETRAFAYLSSVNTYPQYSFGSIAGNAEGTTRNGSFLPDFPTTELSWETTTTTNVGFDGIALNNKLTFTVEWFERQTSDILQEVELSPSVGVKTAPILNLAKVRNRGWEFQVGWSDNIGDFSYSIGGNFTTVNNEVLEVWRDQPFFGNGGRVAVGQPMYHLWGYKTGGIFQTEDEVKAYQEVYEDQNADKTSVSPGDVWFQDVHGAPTEDEPFFSSTPDSIVNSNDRTYIGNTIPTHYYGANIGASWKGFDLSIFFQGIGGLDKYNDALRQGVDMGNRGINQWVNIRNRWTPENPHAYDPNDKANSLPRAVAGDPSGNNRYSDRFVEQAGFMRLRDVTLGYSVPPTLLSKTGWIERLRVYVSGQNLWTVTNWSGLDPENDKVPIPRILSLGVNATF
ncbi:SusC/RagA family TonB-linked outer membrane protein [Flexithrix dorotheae]|uniref:SusC/RagA family TonB-linked outer membrane protein n=1 Tax=Flexithrix dorotheae TaxID=70993 RepID=UPI001B7F9B78|nr:SusC/RagA family TonB-linked outer membrane protein [Flexithrix dorotheae]